jgi:sec-independent protein translocase protein TatB
MDLPHTVLQASFGIPDTLFLMVLALVVFGPRRLPEIGKQIGKLMYEFRKASNDFKLQIEDELRAAEEADRQKKLEQERQATLALAANSTTNTSDAAASSSAEAHSSASAEPVAEAHTIMPPSTGTQVTASRPDFSKSAAATNESEAPPATAPLDTALQNDTPAQVALESGEAAPHHG